MELTPFQLNTKGEKLDLNNKEDVNLTIERNNTLEKVITQGIPMHELDFYAVIRFSFQCFKCGYEVKAKRHVSDESGEGVGAWYNELIDGVKCKHCKTKYSYEWKKGILKAKLKQVYDHI